MANFNHILAFDEIGEDILTARGGALYNVCNNLWRNTMKKTLSIISIALVLVLLAGVLVACAPANAEKAKAKLEKKGYTVEVVEGKEIDAMLKRMSNGMNIDFGAKGMLNADKGQDGIFVVWFETKEKAENFEGMMSFTFDTIGDEIAELEGIIYGSKGKVFFMGTEQGVKDFF